MASPERLPLRLLGCCGVLAGKERVGVHEQKEPKKKQVGNVFATKKSAKQNLLD